MRRLFTISGWVLAIATGISLVVMIAGNAVHWEREPAYVLALSWGHPGSEPGAFNEPTGIAVADNEVFVADARNGRIQVFDRQGRFLRSFGEDELTRPMNLEIAAGRIYVPDYFQDLILVFDLDGTYLDAIASDDGLNSPGGVAVRADGTLLVADTYGQRIVHMTSDGRVLASWGKVGEAGRAAGRFRYPTDVAVAGDGSFYVADGYNHRVQRLGPHGEHQGQWGGPFALGIPGFFRGWFTTATSVAVQENGDVFVADFFNQRIQKFSAAGRFLTSFGQPVDGPQPGPIAVALDQDGSLFVASFGGNRIERWEPGSQ